MSFAAPWPARFISSAEDVPDSIVADSHARVSSALATRAGILVTCQPLSAVFQG
jgi:hypothetical protein